LYTVYSGESFTKILTEQENKGKLVSPGDDEDSREVFGLIKKLNTVPEARKKAKMTCKC
jgi:hypothetical protein